MPSTRPDFWQKKFQSNVERDARAESELLAKDWRVATIWECSLATGRSQETIEALIAWFDSRSTRFETAPPSVSRMKLSPVDAGVRWRRVTT